jgi:hypothetical protein
MSDFVLAYPGLSSLLGSEGETILIAFLLLSSFSCRVVLRIEPVSALFPLDDFLDLPSLLFRLNKLKPDDSAFNPIPRPILDEMDEVEPFRLCRLLGRAYGSEA